MCRRIFLFIGGAIFLLSVLFLALVSDAADNGAVERTHTAFFVSDSTTIDTSALDDPGFESGTPSAYWAEQSLTYGTPICSVAVCGDYGLTGDHYAWFGGVRDQREIAVLSQVVKIEESASRLSGWLKITHEEGQGRLRISLDGKTVGEWDHDDVTQYAQYREIEIDLSDYVDDKAHNLAIDVHTEPNGLVNFFVDDLTLVSSEPTAVHGTSMQVKNPPIPPLWWMIVMGVAVAISVWVDMKYV